MHFFKFKESYSIRKFKAKDMYPRYPNRLVLFFVLNVLQKQRYTKIPDCMKELPM